MPNMQVTDVLERSALRLASKPIQAEQLLTLMTNLLADR